MTPTPEPTPTLLELLAEAARELVNCEATSDVNADRQLYLAAGIRAAAARLREKLADYGPDGDCEDPDVYDALFEINGGPLK